MFPEGFRGVVRVSSTHSVGVVALRGRSDSGGFLFAATPALNDLTANAGPILPHIVSGGGYSTQVAIMGQAGQAISGEFSFRSTEGTEEFLELSTPD